MYKKDVRHSLQTGKRRVGMGGNSDELCCFVTFWIVHGPKFMSAFGSVHRAKNSLALNVYLAEHGSICTSETPFRVAFHILSLSQNIRPLHHRGSPGLFHQLKHNLAGSFGHSLIIWDRAVWEEL